MKTINVAPVEQLEIKLGNNSYICSFNMVAVAYVQEEIRKLKGEYDQISVGTMITILLYAGIRSNDDAFTLDEAKHLASLLSMEAGQEIIEMYHESMPIPSEASKKKKAVSNVKR